MSRACFRRLWASQPPVASELFHYTNVAATKAIVESGRFWATHASYLNDSSEFAYTENLFRSHIERQIAAQDNPRLRDFLEKALSVLDPDKGLAEQFVVCFCEKPDLLSQWRAYGQSDGGYAMGFHPSELNMSHVFAREGNDDVPVQAYLRKVNYELTFHHETIAEIVSAVLEVYSAELLRPSGKDPMTLANEALGVLRAHLVEFQVFFKNPAFSEEAEWRLLCALPTPITMTHGTFLNFRTSSGQLVPYVDLRLVAQAGVRNGRLPLSSVTVGPTVNSLLAKESTRRFLHRNGYPHTEVHASNIPLRAA